MQPTTTIAAKRCTTAPALALIAVTAAAAICVPRFATAGVNTWTALGPDGGRIADVEFSPSVQGELYLAAMSGFHRATLAGTSWTLTRENFGSRPIDVAVDPANADRVLLVTLDGLFASNDHGATFVQRHDAGHAGVAVETSRDGGIVYFASSTRVYRSVNRGDSWSERAPPPTNVDQGEIVFALAVDPSNAAFLYVSVLNVGVFASANGGDSWQQIGAATPALASTVRLVIDPSNRLRLLAATNEGLYISNDGGGTWSATSLGSAAVRDVAVDPTNPSVVYTIHFEGWLMKSVDGGATFNPMPISSPPFRGSRLTIDPLQSSNIVAFSDDSLMLSMDAGATWSERTSGIHATTPQSVASLGTRQYFGVAQSGVHFVEAGSTDLVAVDNARLLQLLPEPPHTVQVLALPGPADTLLVRLNYGVIAKSVNAGLDWTSVWPFPAVDVWHIAASALEPQTIYAGTSEGVYKSLDGGSHWSAASAGLPAGAWVNLIAIAPTPTVLYASVMTMTQGVGSYDFRLYRSLDAGASWTAVSPLQTESIVSLTIDPRDAQVVYAGRVAGDARVRKTTDGGANWTPAMCCQILSFAFDPVEAGTMYAGYSNGAMRSVDGGANWESLFPNAPSHYSVNAIALDAADRHTVLLGVAGFGIRRMTIAPDLELSLTEPASLFAGTNAAYAVNVINRGPSQATNVRVTVTLPANATGLSATAAGGSCAVSGTTITCRYAGLGQSVGTIGSATTISLSATPTATGAFAVSASIAADEPDAITDNNTATSMLNAAEAPVALPPPTPLPPPPLVGGGNSGGDPPLMPVAPVAPPPSPSVNTGGGGGGGGALGLELGALLWLLVPIRRRAARRL